MAASDNIWLKVVVDYTHDLAFGLFPGTVLGAWVIRNAAESLGTGQAAVSQAAGTLWLVMILGVAISVGTGLLRLRYWKGPVRTDAMPTKITMIATKHTVFVMTLLVCAVWLYTIVN